MSPGTWRRYNPGMTRLLGPLLAAWLAVAALALAGAAPALADDPGAATNQTTTSAGYDIGADPLMPYVVALLVVGAGLSVVGVVALWAQRPHPTQRPGTPPDEPPAG